MSNNETKKGVLFNIILAFCATALFFAGVILLYDFTYGVIDDPFIATVLNGAYTGMPDAHVVYIKYPLAWILKTLFTVLPQTNWHFFLLEACFAVCIFVCNFRIASNLKKIGYKLLGMLLFMLLFWLCMAKQVLTAHYSMCAATLAATGIFYFATIRQESSKLTRVFSYMAAFLMLWTAYALRARTLFMLLPLAGAVFLYKFFAEKKPFRIQNIVKYAIFPVVLFIGMGGMELMHNANYKSQGWQAFLTFNDARTTLYDFYALPEYEKNQDFYASLGISKARQAMYEKYYLEFTDGIEDDALPQIAAYREMEFAQGMPTKERIKETFKALPINLTLKTYQPVNWICAALFLIMMILAVLAKFYRVLWTLLFGIFTSLIPWLWMIYMGKPTSRVTMGIWAADLLFLLALVLDQAQNIRTLRKQKKPQTTLQQGTKTRLAAAVLLLICAAFCFGCYQQYPKVTKSVQKSLTSGQIRSGVEAYCESHPERLYICESEVVNALGFDWKAVDNSLQNLYWPGGWTAKMAQSKQIWERFGITNIEQGIVQNDAVYLLSFAETDMTYWTDFYSETYPRAALSPVSQFSMNDVDFAIYQLREE